MNWKLVGQAFEVGVRSALELFKEANSQQLRQQLAESAQKVLEVMKAAADVATKR